MRKNVLICVIIVLSSLISFSVFAQTSQISSGLTWLNSAQTTTGNWPAVETDEYFTTVAALDAAYALEPTSSTYAAALQWMNGQIVSPTDYLSRKIISIKRAGLDATNELEYLLLYRNPDGGWGWKSGYPYYILDTALALQALKAANYSDTTLIGQSLNYLTANQNTDGGWGFIHSTSSGQAQNDASNAYITSMVLRTLAAYNSVFINQASINKASAYLLTKQNMDGGFGSSPSNVYETALSVMSLIESGKGGIQTIQSGINYLTLSQLADGSWNDDPYSTALALQALAEARPNLAVSSIGITFSNSMPQSGATTTISGVIRNTGYDNASNVIIRFYLGDPAVGGAQIGTDQIIPFIALGSSAQASITASFTGTGGKTIFVVVDPDNLISETTKADNKASARLWVATGPDLAVLSEDLKPSTYVPTSGAAFTLEYKIRNLGESAADAFAVSIYDGNPAQGGTLLQTANFSGLNGTEVRTGTLGATFTGYGEHTLYVVADSNNQITELSKTNNTGQVKIFVGGELVYADLVVSQSDITLTPSRPHIGDTVQIAARIKNQGIVTASGVTIEIFDGAPESGGALINSQTISLTVGEEKTVIANWTIPTGIHDIYVIADRQNNILETDKTNNRAITRVMADMVDIAVSATDLAFTPSHPVANDSVALAVTLHNTGIMNTGAFNLALYDGDPMTSGTLLQTYAIANIPGDGSITQTYLFTAMPKTYRFYAVADTENVVTELYEGNNAAVRALTIKTAGETLGPDLTPVRIDMSGTTTNPQTLAISGNAHVSFQNQGDDKITTAFNVLVFEDLDGDAKYTQGVDSFLGTGINTTALWPEGAHMIDVSLAGKVKFLHAPLYAFIDSGDAIREQSEDNNSMRSGTDCEVVPPSQIQTSVKWKWTSTTQPVYQVPMVARLSDTNADGKIDEQDVPVLLFMQMGNTRSGQPGVLRAARGDTGQQLWSVSRPEMSSSSYLAVGDIDNDGLPDIIMPDASGGILALNHDGTFKWDNAQMTKDWCYTTHYPAYSCTSLNWMASPIIADLDGDGNAEIVMGPTVVNSDGSIRWTNTTKTSSGGLGWQFGGYHAIVADIDLDGKQEILAGNTAYRPEDGSVMWQNTSLTDGAVAVGNFDGDPYPEIVFVTATTQYPYVNPGGRVYLLDHQGRIKWGPVYLATFETNYPGTGTGGFPVIADVDGDGQPEIIVKGATHVFVLDKDGRLKWSYFLNYYPSGLFSPVTVFDLDGDGIPEVLMNSNGYFTILNGKDGTLRHSEPFMAWANENPTILVSDVDGDGHADVVLNGGTSYYSAMVTVLKEKNNTWVNARSIWNQLSYHVTNVNDDGSIPQHEAPSWLLNNTYRTQAAIGTNINPYLTPNLTASYLRAEQAGISTNLAVRIGNGGAKQAASGVLVTFYDGPSAGSGQALGVVIGTASTTRALKPGEYQDVILSVTGMSEGLHHVYAVVNECLNSSNCSSRISECNYDDNQAELDLTIATGLPDLKIGTEDITVSAASITEGSIIPITAVVRDQGSVSASNVTVRLYKGNPSTGGQRIGTDQVISSINSGGSAVLTFTFDSLGHAGQNILYVSIDPDNTIVEATRANNTAPVSINVQPPQLPNLVIDTNSIQFAPTNPREGEQVTITATITNRGASAGNIPVRLSLGDPATGGTVIATAMVYPILGLGQSTQVQAILDTAGVAGQQSILAVIDPANTITESRKDDNTASKGLFIQAAGLSASISLDKSSYQAGETLTATITASNSTANSRSLFLTMAVKDSAGNLIATISSGDAVALGPNAAVTLTRTWNIGKNLAGNYSLTTEVAEGGVVIARANAGFTIAPDKSLESKVTTDKISYKPNETATITSTITSQSANYTQEHLSATIQVALPFTGNGNPSGINPDATILYTETKTIATLMPGASFTFKSYWNAGTYAPGAYPVTLKVKDASGALISTGTATITITNVIKPSAVLKGTIAMDRQSLLSGETATVSYSVTNNGNIELQNAGFSVLIVHVVNQTVYDTLMSQATLTMGATYAHTAAIDTANYSAMDYLVVLRANINGIEETLAGTYFRVEGAPTAPALISPAMGSDVDTFTPALTVSNASDPNNDKLTYEFELYADSGMTQLIASSGAVPSGINPDATAGATSWTAPAPLTENQTCYWRSRAYDGKLHGPWMDKASFRVNTINDPPTAPVPLSPADTTSVSALTPVLTVTNASDPDSANLTYNFQVALDPDFTQIVAATVGAFSGQGTTSWQVIPALSENTWYYWRAQADDWQIEGPWSSTFSFFVNTTNEAPTKPVILSPASNAVITSLYADIVLQNSTDIDSPVISYYYEVDIEPSFNSSSTIRSGVIPPGPGTTIWQATGLLDNTLYYVRAMADDGSAGSGWTAPPVSFFVNTANDKPTKPVIANPSIGAEANVLTPTLAIHNATDPDRDLLTYDFEVSSDAAFTNLVASVAGTAETTSTTSWIVTTTLMENKTYYWRARAFDGSLHSDWAEAWFVVNTANDDPGAPALYSPLDKATIATFLPTLSVTNALDPDSDALTYDFEVYNGVTMVWSRTTVPQDPSGTTSVSVTTTLTDNTTYQWRARANDGDRYGPWMTMAAFTVHVQQVGINVKIEVEPETLNQKSKGNWVMVKIELPHGYRASDVDLSSIRLEGVVPAETRPYGQYKHHHKNGCEHDHAEHDHDELKVKFDRSAVLAVLPNGDHVPVHVTGRIGSATFEGVDFVRVIH